MEKDCQESGLTVNEWCKQNDLKPTCYYYQLAQLQNGIKLFHTVETKLLCGYFGLPQLNQMFDEDYFNFEWDMHVGQNYSEHRSDYYRDHFIHQIRDLYMILRLLKDAGFYKASEHILRDPSASKVSEYVFKKSKVFCHDRMGTQQQHLKGVFQSCFPSSQNIEPRFHFLLRFCDDLQEWDRRYFEISKASDLLFCPKCGYPFMKQKQYDDDGHRLHKTNYCCRCQTKEDGLFRPDIFIKRKLYLVSVADRVEVSLAEDENQTALIAKINYDPYKLLMLAKTNPTYAKYREKELKELKRLLADQDFSLMTQNALPFSRIYLDCFMTPNPVLIKVKILETFLRRPTFWGSTCKEHDLLSAEDLTAHLSGECTLAEKKSVLFQRIIEFVFPDSNGREALSKFLKGKKRKKPSNSALAFYIYLLRD